MKIARVNGTTLHPSRRARWKAWWIRPIYHSRIDILTYTALILLHGALFGWILYKSVRGGP